MEARTRDGSGHRMSTASPTRPLRRAPGAATIHLERRDVLERTLELIGARRVHQRQAHQSIAGENRASARSGPLPTDARIAVISETVRRLQGSLLVSEDRRAVLQLAKRLGLRAFDANLLVAVVQDRARRGESVASATLPGRRDACAAASNRWNSWRWIAATLASVGLAVLAANWLLGG